MSLSSTAYLPYGGARTISVWAMTNSATGEGWIFGYGTPGTSQVQMLGIYASTYYYAGWGDDLTGGTPVNGKWFNMVGVYDGTTAYLYINGILISSGAHNWSTTGSTSYIGRKQDGGAYWNGKISNIAVYNRALSTTEITNNFNTFRGSFGI